MTDWIEVFKQDRESMVRIMRENAAADIIAGYSVGQIARQMVDIERYERETQHLLDVFTEHYNGNKKAYEHLKKVGAIA